MITTWILLLPWRGMNLLLELLPGISSMPSVLLSSVSTMFGIIKSFDWLIPWQPLAIGIAVATTWYGIEIAWKVTVAIFGIFMKIKPNTR